MLIYPLMTITCISTTPVLETEVMMFKTIKMLKSIGIIHVFSCINVCRVSKKLLKPRSLG